jgi:hypothetical protein
MKKAHFDLELQIKVLQKSYCTDLGPHFGQRLNSKEDQDFLESVIRTGCTS